MPLLPASGAPSPASPADEDGADGVTLNFDRVDLVEVIHVLARHLRLNTVVDPGVHGVVTLYSGRPVRKDDLLPIFHEVLRIHGAAAVKRGALYRITPLSQGPGLARPRGPGGAGFVMHVLPVRFTPAAAMKRLLAPFMGQGGTILDDVRGNYLVVVDLPSNIRRLSRIMTLMDVEAFAGTRMELVRPRAASARDLAREMAAAMRLSAASTAQGESFAARFLPLPRINRLLVVAYSEAAWDHVKHWLEQLDVADEAQGRRIFIRAVENRKATELARVLNQIYGARRSSPASPKPRQEGPGAHAALWPEDGTDGDRLGPPGPRESSAGLGGSSAAKRARPPASRAGPAPKGADAGVRVAAEPDTNSLVVLATPREYAGIAEVLEGLDQVPRQVLMEVLVAEVTLTDDFEFGVEYALSRRGLGALGADAEDPDTPAPGDGLQAYDPGLASIVEAGRDFRVLVKALMQDARVKVLSSPHILAVDNRPARIRVGSEQPVATGMVVSQEAQATTTTLQFKNVGRILTIVPQVNSEGLVNLQVRVEVSDVGERVMVGRQSFDAFNVRDAETTAVLRDGQTLLIGGIITDSVRRNRIGIPLLMDLPVLGPLFRTDLKSAHRTELVILITPRVIRSQREGEAATREFLDRVRAVRRELEAGRTPPGPRPGPLPPAGAGAPSAAPPAGVAAP